MNISQKKLEKSKKKLLSKKEIEILEESLETLNSGNELNSLDQLSKIFLRQTGLLSLKPKIIVCNVDEENLSKGNQYTEEVKNKYPNEKIINICADIEDQLSGLDKNEKETFMQDIGLSKTGLNQLIKEGYDLLKLDTLMKIYLRLSICFDSISNTTSPSTTSTFKNSLFCFFISLK